MKFSGYGAMPFIGIRISTPKPLGGGLWDVGYRHRDYGSGVVCFSERTLERVMVKRRPPRPELPAELHRPVIDFPGMRVRHAEDSGDSGDANVRYVLKWDTMGANHDRKPKGELPPAGMLRLYKLVRNAD